MAIRTITVLRLMAGETGQEFARAAGLDPARLSKLEHGEPPWTPEVPRIEAHVIELVPFLLWGADAANSDRKDEQHALEI